MKANSVWGVNSRLLRKFLCLMPAVIIASGIAGAQTPPNSPLPVPMPPVPDLSRGASQVERRMWNAEGMQSGTDRHIRRMGGHDLGNPALGEDGVICRDFIDPGGEDDDDGDGQYCRTYKEVVESVRTWAPGYEDQTRDAELETLPYWKNWMGAPIVDVLLTYAQEAVLAEVSTFFINMERYFSPYQPLIPPPPYNCGPDECPGYQWRCGRHYQYLGGQVGRCWWLSLNIDPECLFTWWETSSLVEYYSPSYKMDTSEQEFQSVYYMDGLTDLLKMFNGIEQTLIQPGLMSVWTMMWAHHSLKGGAPYPGYFSPGFVGEQNLVRPPVAETPEPGQEPFDFQWPSTAPDAGFAGRAYNVMVKKIKGEELTDEEKEEFGDSYEGEKPVPEALGSQPHLESVYGRVFPEPLNWVTAEYPYVPHVPKMSPPDERQGTQLPFFGMDAPLPFGSYLHSKFLPTILVPPILNQGGEGGDEAAEDWAEKLAYYALLGPRACMMNNKAVEAYAGDGTKNKTPVDLDWVNPIIPEHSLPADLDNDVEVCLDKIGEVFPITDTRRAHITDGTYQGALKALNALFYYYPLTDNQGMDEDVTNDQNSHHSFIRKVDIWEPLPDLAWGEGPVGRSRLADETDPDVLDELTKVNMEYQWANVKTPRGGGENSFEMYPLFKGCWKPGMKGKWPENEGFPMLAAGVADSWLHLIFPFPFIGWRGFNTAPDPLGIIFHFWPLTFQSKISEETDTRNKLRLY